MASKQVADRKKSSTLVSAAAETHKDTIQKGAEGLLSKHLKKGETMPDLALLSALLGRALASMAHEMMEADDAHEKELSDDAAPREARDSGTQALYGKLVEGTEILQGLYGASAVKGFKLDGTTPRDATLLIQHTKTATGLMRTVKLGKSRLKGVSFDSAEHADSLDALVKSLNHALSDVARETREAEATLAKKNASIASFDAGFSTTASLLSSLLNVGGQKDLASRIRPSPRRPGQVEAPDESTPDEPSPTD